MDAEDSCSYEEESCLASTDQGAELFDGGVEIESPCVVPDSPSLRRPLACVYSETLPKVFCVDGFYYARSDT